MWSNQKSSHVVVETNLKRRPPYCVHPDCRWHDPQIAKLEARFALFGTRKTLRFPYKAVRYRCFLCRRTFSDSFFSFSYRDRLAPTYEQIFDLYSNGYTKMAIAEFLGHSLDTVLRRMRKLAEQSLLQQAHRTQSLKIQEDIAFDGIENFAFSQFDPNNVNHAVGKRSFFIHDFNLSPMNRKGKMSPRQIQKNAALERRFGKYPSNAIELDSKRLFRRILTRSGSGITLHTDKHPAYKRALNQLHTSFSFHHDVTSSRAARNFRNKLFPINHTDLLTRQKSTAYKRETVSFAKHTIAMQEAFVIFMVRKNFMRNIFEKPNVSIPTAHKETPAMRLGLEKRRHTFHSFFRTRLTKFQVKLNRDWLLLFERRDPYSRRPILAYSGL